MSFNQSRSDRSETQYRKSGRSAGSNQQRTSSGSYGKGAGGGPAPSPSVNSSSSLHSSNRSFKKPHNAHGGQSWVNVPAVNSSFSINNASAHRNLQNGDDSQPQLQGASDAPVGGGAAKQVEPSAPQRSTRAVPKAPTSQSASVSLNSTAHTTHVKAPGDPSKAFHFQFGSIGMQIPARTSSAPPNLDEQKRDQARHDTYRTVPNIPIPSVPKEQLPGKDAGALDQSSTGEVHQVSKVKKDPQVSFPPTASQTQKPSVLPVPMPSMQIPYHQPQVSVQFGGHQSQNVTATSLSMPMPISLPMGNAPQVQQHMFVPGLHPHPLQPQGLMHQGHGMGFTTQMGPPQMPPQLGNRGIGITPQYPQQQGGNFGGGPRKTVVKITHPDTHKEVRLDERVDTYSDGGVARPRSQSQPIPSFSPAHPINYNPISYGSGSIYYPASGSLPLTSTQITPNTQATRFNYTVGQGSQSISFTNPNLNSLPVTKSGTPMPGVVEPPKLDQSCDVQATVKPPLGSVGEKTAVSSFKPPLGSVGEKSAVSSLSYISPAVGKVGTSKPSRPSGDVTASHPQSDSETIPENSSQQEKPSSNPSVYNSLEGATKQSAAVSSLVSTESVASNFLSIAPSEESVPITNVEGRRREFLSGSNSIKDHQEVGGKTGQNPTQKQVGGQSTNISSLTWRTAETGISSNSGVSETKEPKTTSESLSANDALSSDIYEAKADSTKLGITSVSSEVSGAGNGADILETGCDATGKLAEPSPSESSGTEERGGETLPERFQQDITPSDTSQSGTSKSPELVSQTERKSVLKATAVCIGVPILGTTEGGLGESARTATEADKVVDNMDVTTSGIVDSTDVESSHGSKTSTLDALLSRSDIIQPQSAPDLAPEFLETIPKNEGEVLDYSGAGSVLLPVASSNDKPVVELNRSKSSTARGKKKKKEILQKADAAGTTSDLYMAYKGPEEKKETVASESVESTPAIGNSKQAPADTLPVDTVATEKSVESKEEPDDWEDAADISTPKLEPSDGRKQALGVHCDENENGNVGKKYSRDFLLKFAKKCTDLPEGFKMETDIEEALMSGNINGTHLVDRDSYPSPGRVMDRQSGGPRADRRGSVMVDDDRWGRPPGPSLGRDLRLDLGYGANAGFRPGQGGNYGVLRNLRAQIPMQYPGSILPGPMQPMGPQGGMQRNGPDADRWQRIANFQQKGLIPSPQTPLQMMHKADRKYEVGKVQDEEEIKQRRLKAILNKLTPQNFEKLFEQVKAVNIDNADTLTGVISQIFDKALMEPTFCEMYANFCYYLDGELPDFSEDNEKITFKRLLLNKCQEEFEREQEEANKADNEGEIKQTEEEREEKRIKARRRMLGNIRLIGELYKKKMLTERIMHECIQKLLGQYENPDEEDVEALCKLMSTIGEMIDHPKAKDRMDAYFHRMAKLSNNMKLSSRVRFMLKDAIELRKNKWQQRRKVEGPKKIEEVHRDAAQERQAQTSRLARGPSMSSSTRRAPMDFGPRGLSSPTNQVGSFSGMPTQNRGGYGAHDVRFEDRKSYEARTLSVPLTQRPTGDDSITLGPQGGLARGMSTRGSPTMSSTPLPDNYLGAGEPRRMTAGLNGFSTLSERPAYGSREDIIPRYHTHRLESPPAFDHLSAQQRNTNCGNRNIRTPERGFDQSVATSPPTRGQGPAVVQNVPSEKVWPEERLRDMSMAAIKEFYSARDEKEVALCIKDLNSSGFHPSMVSLWVTDSFERKDVERDLLAKLLVNLTKSRDGNLSQGQLIKGFESVLTTLEDAVNDAPKAAEFLGCIFAKFVEENVIQLREIGRLLHEGGEEPGRLMEIGLAGDVLGSTLEVIKSDKGETVLHEIRMSSNLRLEDFRPPDPYRSRILEKFI